MADSRQLGILAEDAAARHFETLGYRIIHRNWRCRHGEIDIIAENQDGLVFIEVKFRSSMAFGDPVLAVNPRKVRRLTALASAYVQSSGRVESNQRLCVASILGTPGEAIRLTWVDND